MRAFVNLQALVSLDVDQVQKVLNQEITFDDNDADTAAVMQSGLVSLAASETSTPFNFGSVTSASLLIVIAYQDVSLQLDDVAAPSIPVRVTPASDAESLLSRFQREDQPGLVVWRGKVSSLFLTNLSTTDVATAFVAVVGNAA
jgi:hypothetical protein